MTHVDGPLSSNMDRIDRIRKADLEERKLAKDSLKKAIQAFDGISADVVSGLDISGSDEEDFSCAEHPYHDVAALFRDELLSYFQLNDDQFDVSSRFLLDQLRPVTLNADLDDRETVSLSEHQTYVHADLRAVSKWRLPRAEREALKIAKEEKMALETLYSQIGCIGILILFTLLMYWSGLQKE
jgi:hypothetical protein